MGVYIKGMEMPTSCWMCIARTDVNIGVGIADGCNLLKEMISNPNERLPDCPLVLVPPHGRLIDADALREDWLENGENEYIYDTNAILCSLDAAPAIIPAEEATQREERQDEAPAGPYDLLYEEGGPDA